MNHFGTTSSKFRHHTISSGNQCLGLCRNGYATMSQPSLFRSNRARPRYPTVQLYVSRRSRFEFRKCTKHCSRFDYCSKTTETNPSRQLPLRGRAPKRSLCLVCSAIPHSAPGREYNVKTALSVNGWQRRWTVVAFCFVAFMLCNMDRVNMSIAILPMAKEFGWSNTIQGLVQSSFFWGYLLTQVLGGIIADRIGGKPVLGFGVVWWSMSTIMTPFAVHLGLPWLLACRACMGIGEGVAMPAMNQIISRWIPVQERSRSLSLVYSGMYMGSVIGLLMSPPMIRNLGWASVFVGFGALGLIWMYYWARHVQSSPQEDSSITVEERNYITAQTCSGDDKRTKNIPWRKIFSNAPVWAIIVSHFCHNWGTFILLTWMPTYYTQVLGFSLFESGIYSVLPWLVMAASANVGGALADRLVRSGLSVTRVRKIMQSVGFIGPAIFMAQLAHVVNPGQAVLCMVLCQACDAFSQSGLYSNHQDIGPRYAGVLLGISNTAGVLAGVVGTAVTGLILQNGTWNQVWYVSIVFYLIGALVWNLFASGERQF